jgi:PRTRC genetic system protein F
VNHTASEQFPATLPGLTVPRIASDIPHHIVPRRLATADAAIARFLVEAGTVQDSDIPDSWNTFLEVCQSALDKWVKRELGPLHCLSPSFGLTANGNTNPYMGEREFAKSKEKLCYHSVQIYWGERQEKQWVIGAKLEEMERACAGFGQAVLQILQRYSANVYPIFTPDQACYQASVQYWMGEPSEQYLLDTECADDEERDAMLEDMVTRDDLIDAYPAWAITFPNGADKKSNPQLRLKRLRKRVSDPALRAIADNALALAELGDIAGYEADVDGEYLGWGALLSWREDDVSVRIYDDMVNMAYQGEYCDRIGELEIALDAPQAMQTWQRAMQVRFMAIRLIDSLIYQLAERY